MIRGLCPDCGGARPLADYLAEPAARSALAAALACPAPLAARLVAYLDLHAPPPSASGPRRRLASAKLARLLTELAALLTAGDIHRHGARLPCPPALWEQALDEVLAARDGGGLKLPLAGHGYLRAVAWALAEADAARGQARDRGQAPLHPSHRPWTRDAAAGQAGLTAAKTLLTQLGAPRADP